MTIFFTLLLSLIIIASLLALFLWVKTPYYRVDRDRMIKVLEMVLTSQATENDWRTVFDMTIRHDPELETLRQQACEIEEEHFIGMSPRANRSESLFSKEGMRELEKLLQTLKSINQE